ncbi:non-specific lipid-transfer protein 1-like [Euphorbia lathyris]|uniref:non-specific lipid-transfer protein 1-like n=1 Tax=Euphorbia lathyris TaxID=212925 RepID=UPI003314362C
MAGVKLAILVVAIMVVGGGMSAEGVTCGQVNSALAPCLNYLKSGGVPTTSCCSGVATIAGAAKTTADRQQACSCLKSAANGVGGIIPANAESLPSKCKVNIPYKISLTTNCNSIK